MHDGTCRWKQIIIEHHIEILVLYDMTVWLGIPCLNGAVIVVIVWELDLQLPVQSVPITTTVVSSNPSQVRCTRYNIM